MRSTVGAVDAEKDTPEWLGAARLTCELGEMIACSRTSPTSARSRVRRASMIAFSEKNNPNVTAPSARIRFEFEAFTATFRESRASGYRALLMMRLSMGRGGVGLHAKSGPKVRDLTSVARSLGGGRRADAGCPVFL